MTFTSTNLSGVWLIEPTRLTDERGFFARVLSPEAFYAQGLIGDLPECSIAFNPRRGTLRGMHFQRPPHEEAKLVRCTRGAIFDVALDLRPESASFGQWFGARLDAEGRRSLYIPHGCAHGYLTLTDDAEVFYQISSAQAPHAADGVRWNDPRFQILWPFEPELMSDRDRHFPDYIEALP